MSTIQVIINVVFALVVLAEIKHLCNPNENKTKSLIILGLLGTGYFIQTLF